MNKQQLVESMAQSANLTKADAERLLHAFHGNDYQMSCQGRNYFIDRLWNFFCGRQGSQGMS